MLVDDAEARRAGEELVVLEHGVPATNAVARGRVDRARMTIDIAVVLPAPFAPSSPKISPCATPAHMLAHATVGGAPGRFGR